MLGAAVLLLVFVGLSARAWFGGSGLKLGETMCAMINGVVQPRCGFSECNSFCLRPSRDAYEPCSDSKQCKYGCFVSSDATQLGKLCQINDVAGGYSCSTDIKLDGQCAPLDTPTLMCAGTNFFQKYDYQLKEEGKVVPVFPFGLSYGCPTS